MKNFISDLLSPFHASRKNMQVGLLSSPNNKNSSSNPHKGQRWPTISTSIDDDDDEEDEQPAQPQHQARSSLSILVPPLVSTSTSTNPIVTPRDLCLGQVKTTSNRRLDAIDDKEEEDNEDGEEDNSGSGSGSGSGNEDGEDSEIKDSEEHVVVSASAAPSSSLLSMETLEERHTTNRRNSHQRPTTLSAGGGAAGRGSMRRQGSISSRPRQQSNTSTSTSTSTSTTPNSISTGGPGRRKNSSRRLLDTMNTNSNAKTKTKEQDGALFLLVKSKGGGAASDEGGAAANGATIENKESRGRRSSRMLLNPSNTAGSALSSEAITTTMEEQAGGENKESRGRRSSRMLLNPSNTAAAVMSALEAATTTMEEQAGGENKESRGRRSSRMLLNPSNTAAAVMSSEAGITMEEQGQQEARSKSSDKKPRISSRRSSEGAGGEQQEPHSSKQSSDRSTTTRGRRSSEGAAAGGGEQNKESRSSDRPTRGRRSSGNNVNPVTMEEERQAPRSSKSKTSSNTIRRSSDSKLLSTANEEDNNSNDDNDKGNGYVAAPVSRGNRPKSPSGGSRMRAPQSLSTSISKHKSSPISVRNKTRAVSSLAGYNSKDIIVPTDVDGGLLFLDDHHDHEDPVYAENDASASPPTVQSVEEGELLLTTRGGNRPKSPGGSRMRAPKSPSTISKSKPSPSVPNRTRRAGGVSSAAAHNIKDICQTVHGLLLDDQDPASADDASSPPSTTIIQPGEEFADEEETPPGHHQHQPPAAEEVKSRRRGSSRGPPRADRLSQSSHGRSRGGRGGRLSHSSHNKNNKSSRIRRDRLCQSTHAAKNVIKAPAASTAEEDDNLFDDFAEETHEGHDAKTGDGELTAPSTTQEQTSHSIEQEIPTTPSQEKPDQVGVASETKNHDDEADLLLCDELPSQSVPATLRVPADLDPPPVVANSTGLPLEAHSERNPIHTSNIEALLSSPAITFTLDAPGLLDPPPVCIHPASQPVPQLKISRPRPHDRLSQSSHDRTRGSRGGTSSLSQSNHNRSSRIRRDRLSQSTHPNLKTPAPAEEDDNTFDDIAENEPRSSEENLPQEKKTDDTELTAPSTSTDQTSNAREQPPTPPFQEKPVGDAEMKSYDEADMHHELPFRAADLDPLSVASSSGLPLEAHSENTPATTRRHTSNLEALLARPVTTTFGEVGAPTVLLDPPSVCCWDPVSQADPVPQLADSNNKEADGTGDNTPALDSPAAISMPAMFSKTTDSSKSKNKVKNIVGGLLNRSGPRRSKYHFEPSMDASVDDLDVLGDLSGEGVAPALRVPNVDQPLDNAFRTPSKKNEFDIDTFNRFNQSSPQLGIGMPFQVDFGDFTEDVVSTFE
jgi:hypothetical protein